MKIQVCIPTYERVESLSRLMGDLEREGAKHVSIYDDCSSSDYTSLAAKAAAMNWRWRRTEKNHGKLGFPRLIDTIWRDLGRFEPADFYVFMQDDLRLCSRFFTRLLDTWKSIDSSSKATLMLMTDTRDAIWGSSKPPKPLGKADRIGWVDTIFACPHQTMKDLGFAFPLKGVAATATGSGAGMSLSKALRAKERTMYRANPSLVAHVGGLSVMHPKERQKHPLLAKNFIDGEKRHAALMEGKP